MCIFQMTGRVDSGNATALEEELQAFTAKYKAKSLVLDAEKLDYISSAGLRALLRVRKRLQSLRLVNVQPQVYEILKVTGFTELLETERALRQLSVDGCTVIGQGAHGTVYRISPDTVVKVYDSSVALEAIRRERELSRWAFVKGIPTAIPHDVVRVGDRYGMQFELLDAVNAPDYVRASPEHVGERDPLMR